MNFSFKCMTQGGGSTHTTTSDFLMTFCHATGRFKAIFYADKKMTVINTSRVFILCQIIQQYSIFVQNVSYISLRTPVKLGSSRMLGVKVATLKT